MIIESIQIDYEHHGRTIILLDSLGEFLTLLNDYGKKDELNLRNEHIDLRMNDEITYFLAR